MQVTLSKLWLSEWARFALLIAAAVCCLNVKYEFNVRYPYSRILVFSPLWLSGLCCEQQFFLSTSHIANDDAKHCCVCQHFINKCYLYCATCVLCAAVYYSIGLSIIHARISSLLSIAAFANSISSFGLCISLESQKNRQLFNFVC